MKREAADVVETVELSSVDILDISFSPASFQSFKDILDFLEPFRCSQTVLTPREDSCSGRSRAAAILQHPSIEVPAHLCPAADAAQPEAPTLFQCSNRTGLALTCHGGATATSTKMVSAAGVQPLGFSPKSSRVYLPDFGREVSLFNASYTLLCCVLTG